MTLRRLFIALCGFSGITAPLAAQSAAAACGMKPDATARQVIKVFGDLRVCMLAIHADTSSLAGPREWNATGSPLIVETQRQGDLRRMMVAGDQVEWAINGQPKPVDSAVVAWRIAIVDLLEPAWEAADLRATANRLTADIDSLPTRRQRLEADIAALEHRVREMRSQIPALQARDRTLASEITTIEGRLRSLESQATRQRALANSSDAGTRSRAEAALRQVEREISTQEDRLRRTERSRQSLDADHQVGIIELELQNLRPDHTLALWRLRLGEMTPESETLLKRELADLEADERLRVLDGRVEKALERLRATMPPA